MKEEKGKIIIPAYEPDERLIQLIKELCKKSDAKLFVVNDGSSRESEGFFLECESYATVLSHDRNYGKGKAVKTALEYIMEQDQKGEIVIADADGQHKVHDILYLLKKGTENKDSLLLGSRSFHGNIPLKSRLGNKITRGVFRILSGKWLKDTQTGLRAFDSGMIPRLLAVPGERYEYETNVLLMCVKEKIDVMEVPVETVYLDGNKSSHFRVLNDSVRIYVDLLKFAASSFISFCADFLIYSLMLYAAAALHLSFAEAVCNVLARMGSAVLNYHLNRRYVFEAQGVSSRFAVKYAVLASAVLLVNTVLLVWLVKSKGINGWAAKAAVEAGMFIGNFLVQKLLIFSKKEKVNK